MLRKGATTETYSAIQLDQFDAMKFLPQIRREPDGSVDASPELPVQALMERVGGGRDNIVVRGVLPIALQSASEGEDYRRPDVQSVGQ